MLRESATRRKARQGNLRSDLFSNRYLNIAWKLKTKSIWKIKTFLKPFIIRKLSSPHYIDHI